MPSPGTDAEILTFDLAGGRYALATRAVREVVRAVEITVLPGAPRVIDGVVDVRGELVPVLNLRRRFRLPETEVAPGEHFVVVRWKGRALALRVDRVGWIARVADDDLRRAGDVVRHAEHVAGIARLPDGVVLIADLDRFLSQAEGERLGEALAGAPTGTAGAAG